MKKTITAFVCLALFPFNVLAANILDQPVTTDKGLVSGAGAEVRSFKGIPYAKPPVGELRWRAPQPVEAWSGIRDGSRFGRDCIQPSEYSELRGGGMSEDCLFVNVWTPARSGTERLPVMVWIHGGAFTYGSGSLPSYDGEALAKRGIVVVTLNYRLGLLGFMAHPQLTAESPQKSSGNYGLQDQIAALKWVQRNIGAFGGDPNRVTVAGQSAGAMSINTLMTSDHAKGLFQQVILQSVGVMRPMLGLKEAELEGLKTGSSIDQLRKLDATRFIQKKSGNLEVSSQRAIRAIVDGSIVKQDDYSAYHGGQYARMPMIVGSNLDEGGGSARTHAVKTISQFAQYIARNFPGGEREIAQAYSVQSDSDVQQALADLISDTQYLYGTRELLRLVSQDEPRLYRYVFSQHRNNAVASPVHGSEFQYPFDNLSASHRGRVRPVNEHDIKVASEMAAAWVRFVKTGDPNGGTLPVWPRYSRDSKVYMDFGKEIRSRTFGESFRLDVIRDYYTAWHRPL